VGGFGNHFRWIVAMHNGIPWKLNNTFTTCDKKLNFILDNVYPMSRTWNNWLDIEWKYRTLLDSTIIFKHQEGYRRSKFDQNSLVVHMDPDLAYYHYFKLNPLLNHEPIGVFKWNVSDFNVWIEENLLDNKCLVVYGEKLLAPILNRQLYNSLRTHFGFEDQYDSCNQIHDRWYKLLQKAQKDFVKTTNELYPTKASGGGSPL
jgi:hypothetical protein